MDHHHRHELEGCDCGSVDLVHTLSLVGATSDRLRTLKWCSAPFARLRESLLDLIALNIYFFKLLSFVLHGIPRKPV